MFQTFGLAINAAQNTLVKKIFKSKPMQMNALGFKFKLL